MSDKSAAVFANHADLDLTSNGCRLAFCEKVVTNASGDVKWCWHSAVMLPLEFLPEFANAIADLNRRYQEATLRGPGGH